MEFDEEEARQQYEALVERAQAGEEFIISPRGKPLARLVGIPKEEPAAGKRKSQPGSRRRR